MSTLQPSDRPRRVVSLLPSATELVCAVGGREELVGISHECDHPADVAGLPVVTASSLDTGRPSGAIDRDVRALLRDALSVYSIEVELLRELDPDVIVTQDLCDVCAVSYDDVRQAVREWLRPEVRLVNLHPTRLADVREDLARVGTALDREKGARWAQDEFDQRIDAVRRTTSELGRRPRVLTLEWLEPAMVGGTWMPELVSLAGGEPLVTRPGEPAPTLDRAALAALDPAPEVVLIKPCGYSMERILEERALLDEILRSVSWPAVEAGAVWLADGHAFFNRPGPRLADSLEILAACLHPETFPELAEAHGESYRRYMPD